MELRIEQTEFRSWREAYVVSLGQAEMVVVAEIGPRILSLSVGRGLNLLFVDEEMTLGSEEGTGDWRLYGGHRIWVAPETDDSSAPDNVRCEVKISDEGLTVLAPVAPRTQLQKRLTISQRRGRFVVEQGVRNCGDSPTIGAVWALTCVLPDGVVAFPWGSGGAWDLKKIVYWKQWLGSGTDVTSDQWQPGPDVFCIEPTGEEGKVGSNPPEGWVALCREDGTFIKSYRWAPGARYPDEDCSLQVYTCDHFVELETLGPLTTFHPGIEVVHEEVWTVTAAAIDPRDGKGLRELLV